MKKTNVQRKSGDTDAEKEQAAAKIQKEDADSSPTKPWVSGTMTKVIKVAAPVAAGVVALEATPAVIGALGFGTVGITPSSLAAKAMSLAATSGYGMTVVSALQSVGAAGLSTTQVLVVGGALAAGMYKLPCVQQLRRSPRKPPDVQSRL